MKKLLLSVFALAILITSCNKYANDFQALKDQIAALSLKVDGVTALQSQLTSTTAQITALQAAVAALPTASSVTALATALTTANANIAAIQTKLNDLATTGATAASVAALKTQLEGIIADKAASDATTAAALAALQSKLDAAATSAEIADLRTAILDQILASAQTTDAAVIAQIGVLKADITQAIKDGTDDVNGKIADLQSLIEIANAANAASLATVIANLGTLQTTVDDNNTVLTASVTGLQLALAAAQRDLTILLNASAMYNDDVNISTDADVDFYLAKLYQMGIINGNLIVNTESITKIEDLNKILGAVVAVIGTNDATLVISAGNHWWNHNNWTITTVAGSGHFVNIESQATDLLKAPLLTSIRGNYEVYGADIADPKIDNVGGTVILDYPGAYESASLKTVGGDLKLVTQVGTLDISFPNVVVGGNVGDDAGVANGTVVFSAAGTSSINFGLATTPVIKNLTAANATAIVLGYEEIQGLVVVAPKALTIDFPVATASVGSVSITTWAATAINLAKLATSTGAVTLTTANVGVPTYFNGTVDLSVFNSNIALTITGPKTVTLPALAKATLTANQAETVTLAVFEWASVPTLNAVKWLTLGGVKNVVATDTYNGTLLTADIHGATPAMNHWNLVTAGVTSSAVNTKLTSLTISGTMGTVALANLGALTTLSTSDIINSLTLDNADAIVAVDLKHNAFVGDTGFGGPGSDLTVVNNLKLASLAPTSLDWLHSLTVNNNAALASFNFSSYHTVIYSGASTSIAIDAPATMGDYVNGVGPVSAGNPGIQAIIKSDDIMTLKNYIIAVQGNTHVTTKTFSLNIGIPVATTLTAKMNANNQIWNFGYTNLVTAGPLDNLDELSLVVAE